MEEKDIHIRIQQYLDHTMTKEDQVLFEKELKTNPQLKEDFDLISHMETELGDKTISDFKKKLDVIMDEPMESTSEKITGKTVSFNRRILSIAASFLLLAGAAWWAFSGNDAEKYNSLANANFVHLPATEIRGGENDEVKVYESYVEKDYKTAAPLLREEGNKTKDSQKWLFSAISYLALENPNECLNLLSKMENDPVLNNEKFYYQGLAFLKKGNKTKAIDAFNKINEAKPFLYKKAQEILVKLE